MNFLVNCVKGIAIGAGAILPGISSGVICVIFGIYENLINNSIKYNKNGTIIYFKMWKSKNLFISVGDNGIGIDKSIKDNIFEAFVTSNSARTSGNGTGLGLSIVKSLVEMHGGEIILVDKPKNGMKTEFLIKIKI